MVANISLFAVNEFFGDLRLLISLSSNNRRVAAEYGAEAALSAPKSRQALDEATREVESLLRRTANLQEVLPCAHIEAAAKRLRYWHTRADKSWDDLFHRACALRDAIEIELKGYLFYVYPKDKGQKYNAFQAEWKPILDAFPAALADAFGALDCWALRHPTASVFHSMRVAEIGLRALARERRLRLPKNKAVEWATWQEILAALDAEIKRIGVQMKAGRAKDAALAFYSGARADLNGFKDEFRNAVMHVRNEYDELQALRALTQVHAFMGRLAKHLSDQSPRISWTRAP